MKLLRSLSLSLARRLILGFALVLALMIAVAAVGTWSVRAVGAQLNGIVEANNVRIALAHDMLDGINDMAILARNVTMLTDVKVIDAQIKVLKAAEASYQTTQKALQDVLAVSATAAETELMRQIASAAAKTIPLMLEAAQQGSDGDSVSALATLTRQVQPVETVLRARVGELVKFQQDQIGVASLAAASAQKPAQLIQFALVAVALGLGTLVAWQITRSVTQPIGRAIMVAERIAQGDLTSKIEVRIPDETGRLLLAIGAMQDRLRGLVGDIRASADSIRVASAEVASGNQNLSDRTERAASNLQQTASSMEQLSGALRQSSESARQANTLAASAAEVAGRGGVLVSEVVAAMDRIHAASHKIADIIGVIDGIAFQTNILALNAAVEAARAGEQGRGFAVVASEVRSLAQRSAEAAKEIKALIGASVDQVEVGSRRVFDAGQTMQEIVAAVQRVSAMIGEVTAASTEQSGGVGRVSAAVHGLDQMTQQNAALVEQSAAAAESLKDQSARLAEMVGAFRLDRRAVPA